MGDSTAGAILRGHFRYGALNFSNSTKENTMPQTGKDNMKGTSPSPVVQHGVNQDWAAQQRNSTDASILNQQYNKKPVDVPKK